MSDPSTLETATLGGGCFWCLEAVYRELKGVERVVSGYAGGAVANPDYESVCSGTTGHAEVVQVTFDPKVIAYRDLLDVFFTIHDPTTKDRQGGDVGTQYRSVLFYADDAQKTTATDVIREVNGSGLWKDPVVTQLVPAEPFYPAEDYHQQYFEKNPLQPYCRMVVGPKVAKFRKKHFERLKK
jgi:peptide-methionine (S)-S-oxide reductase